jgi:hypothetical protein
MNEITIKRHSFDIVKNRLKKFSEKENIKFNIDKVRTEGDFFGLGDHNVTGSELNSRIESIQENFIDINKSNNEIIKEFKEIYNAFDALDKDYITSILANVRAIEKTSNDIRVQQNTLKKHNEKLVTQQNKLDLHQVEIEKNVANISKIVTALRVFKEKLDGYNHLTDIDVIWNECKMIQNKINLMSDNITGFSKKVADEIKNVNKNIEDSIKVVNIDYQNKISTLSKKMSSLNKKIEEYITFTSKIYNVTHLMDIDEIWEQMEDSKFCINRIEKEVEFNKNRLNELGQVDSRIRESIDLNIRDIGMLKEYKEKICKIIHIEDIDSMWISIEEHKLQLEESKKRYEDLLSIIYRNKDEIDKNVIDKLQMSNIIIEHLNKKFKYMHYIAGFSVGLAIFETILLFLKVI